MLPKLVAPHYTVKLVSLPKPVTIRPYLVKEEKLLLMAQQGEDPAEMDAAVRQILVNCTDGAVNVDKLPSFDMEYLFLQLRGKSVNNIIDTKFQCENVVNGVKCGTLVPISINIDDIKISVPEGHTNKIMLTDTLGIVLKYPTATIPLANDIIDGLSYCLDSLFDTKTNEVWEMSEQPPQDIKEFIESLTLSQVELIKPFFETMPRIAYTFTFVCPKCQYQESITLAGLSDFFG